ncbi:MAG: histidine phosphatase family protein [Chloroflexota bacterium]|nr:histidine phosphatase family protein [Chloroflexota bacterium]
MSVAIVYETHSTTLDNEPGFATGWLPGELSYAGRENAADLGRRRRDDAIDAVFTSDLARAVETARIAFGDSGVPIIQDARLRECNYGDLNGAPVATLNADRACRIEAPFPGGESYRQVVQRTQDFLGDLARDWDGKRVVLIAHSANRWALQTLLNGTTLLEGVVAPFEWQEGWSYTLPSCWTGD